MISYAQNEEDVVLARALPRKTGFYIDVGAADPDVASVTRHFYDRGWSGINIEPRPDAVARLRERRPRDTTIEVAAGEGAGSLTFYRVLHDPDQSTFDLSNVANLRDQGHQAMATTVEVRTLNSILEEFSPPAIDFLKIDVEGAEGQVLAGLDLTRWRPRVILIEAVRPWSSQRVDDAWRALIEARGYSEALFDGLNLFFVAEEARDEIGSLAPASVLDRFTSSSVQAMEDELARLRDYIYSLEGELARRDGQALLSAGPVDDTQSPPGHSDLPRDDVARVEPGVTRGLRVAVCSSARGAAGRLAGRLAEQAGVAHFPVDHPGDLDFDDLPDEIVLEIDRPPSRLLARLFAEHLVDVVAVTEAARDAETGLPSGAQWAARLSSVTVAEGEVADDPDGVVLRVLEELELDLERGPAARSTRRLRLLDGQRDAGRLRLALLGTPRTGNTWIRRVLADGFALTELPVHGPLDVDWEALPERSIVQLHWPRTTELEALLDRHGVRVISPARHPLDVLLSILAFANKDLGTESWLNGLNGDECILRGVAAGSDEFFSYAMGPRAQALLEVTPDWWAAPGTVRVRYEDLVAEQTVDGFSTLADRLGLPAANDIEAAVRINTPQRLSELSGGVHVWRAEAGAYREVLSLDQQHVLAAAHESVFRRLGYSIPWEDELLT